MSARWTALLKNLVAQTLGKASFEFSTFLAAPRRPDIRAARSIGQYGLEADLGCELPERPLRAVCDRG